MIQNKIKQFVVGLLVLLISGCSTVPTVPEGRYEIQARESLYKLDRWSFDGRLAITGKNDAWSASINWLHVANDEKIKLAGPLGQGATIIQLSGNLVTIDRGDNKPLTSTQPELFINQQLGLFVPVQSLRYWVVGVPEPGSHYNVTPTGFTQAGWLIDYKQTLPVNSYIMPYKISVSNEQLKLKLIIDQWVLNDAAVQ
ncbi:MAG: lipoprotein insertase outer membrane protein LolB [Methylococcales bacterium]